MYGSITPPPAACCGEDKAGTDASATESTGSCDLRAEAEAAAQAPTPAPAATSVATDRRYVTFNPQTSARSVADDNYIGPYQRLHLDQRKIFDQSACDEAVRPPVDYCGRIKRWSSRAKLLIAASATATVLFSARAPFASDHPQVEFSEKESSTRTSSKSLLGGTWSALHVHEGAAYGSISDSISGLNGDATWLTGNEQLKEREGSSAAVACKYDPMFELGFSTSDKIRSITGIQTSKKYQTQQWSDFECLATAEDDILPGKDAANIIIELPRAPPAPSPSKDGPIRSSEYQTILGFGGSITEATALNWKSLGAIARDAVLELLYGESGLGYTLGRVPMGSCDFSVSSYNFAEEEDLTLQSFDRDIKRDVDNGMVDMIKLARYVAAHSWEGVGDTFDSIHLVASPWSPPAWMKRPLSTDKFDAFHASTMERTAVPECLREGTAPNSLYAIAWARYFSEFLSAYSRHGIDFWAVTVQSDPLSLLDSEACAHDMTTEKEFVVSHLGPVLEKDHPEIKILAYDTNKDRCLDFMEHFWDVGSSLGSGNKTHVGSTRFVDGVALHWYSRSHHSLDGGEGTPNMHRLKALASSQVPMKNASSRITKKSDRTLRRKGRRISILDLVDSEGPILLDSEASHCEPTGYAIGDLNVSWQRAERNAHAILSQFAAGSNGWIEWNMILDPFGGPNHVENFCDAPLIAVPHRAEDIESYIEPVPSFEKHQLQNGESIRGEYETKFALSANMGYPMSLLNLGIVAQPMYYYMGHISRYVRPGSRPLKTIVDQSSGETSSRTFRPTGRVEAGGGYNTNAHAGTEVTLWPCEGSTRQSWSFNQQGMLQIVQYDDKTHSMECVSLAESADPDLGGLLLTNCGAESGHFHMTSIGESQNLVRFLSKQQNGRCLGIRPLANGGGAYGERGGAQADLVPCTDGSASWSFSIETGEVTSTFFNDGEVCMTTGWPYLQAGVFDTTETSGEGSMVIVILNESDDNADFVVKADANSKSSLLKASIPAHSIQTFQL